MVVHWDSPASKIKTESRIEKGKKVGRATSEINRASRIWKDDKIKLGKVVGRGGLLVLRWQHGGQDLDTGIRADDRTSYPQWVAAIDAVTATKTRTGRD